MNRAYVIVHDGSSSIPAYGEWFSALSDAFEKAEALEGDPNAKFIAVFDSVLGEWVKEFEKPTGSLAYTAEKGANALPFDLIARFVAWLHR